MIDPMNPRCVKCRYWPSVPPSRYCGPCRQALTATERPAPVSPDRQPANGRLITDDRRGPDIYMALEVRDGAVPLGAIVIRHSTGHENGRLVPEGVTAFTRGELWFTQPWEEDV